MITHHLRPTGAGKDELNAIEFDSAENKIVTLGRNLTTTAAANGKNFQFLSRSHVEVIVEEGTFYIKPTSRQEGMVYKNWQVCQHNERSALDVDDTISLLGNISYFNYQLQLGPFKNALGTDPTMTKKRRIEEESEGDINVIGATTTSNISGASSSSSSSAPSTTHPSTKELDECSECTICLDTIAFAHNLMCGDAFCYSCIVDWCEKSSKCPYCQEDFDQKAIVHNKSLDKIIYEIVRASGTENLAQYEARMEQGRESKKKKAATASPRAGAVVDLATNNPSGGRQRVAAPAPVPAPAPPIPQAHPGGFPFPFPWAGLGFPVVPAARARGQGVPGPGGPGSRRRARAEASRAAAMAIPAPAPVPGQGLGLGLGLGLGDVLLAYGGGPDGGRGRGGAAGSPRRQGVAPVVDLTL